MRAWSQFRNRKVIGSSPMGGSIRSTTYRLFYDRAATDSEMGGGGVRPAILEFFPIRCLFLGFGGVRWQEEFGWMSRVGFII